MNFNAHNHRVSAGVSSMVIKALGAATIVGATVMAILNIPDLVRYVRMRRM